MNNDELNTFLAMEVMGWHTGDKELDMPSGIPQPT